jgi:hypothetical protein
MKRDNANFREPYPGRVRRIQRDGVSEKSDLAQATETESKHSSLDINGSISASYNGGAYSLTASVGTKLEHEGRHAGIR